MSSGSPTMQRLYGPPKLSLRSTPNTSAVPPQATTKLDSRSDMFVISPTSLSFVHFRSIKQRGYRFPIEKSWGREKCLSPLKRTYSVMDYYSISFKFPRIILIYKYLLGLHKRIFKPTLVKLYFWLILILKINRMETFTVRFVRGINIFHLWPTDHKYLYFTFELLDYLLIYCPPSFIK